MKKHSCLFGGSRMGRTGGRPISQFNKQYAGYRQNVEGELVNFLNNPEKLLQQALARDSQAWDELFLLLWPILCRTVRIVLRDIDDATVEDVVQNVFALLFADNGKRWRDFDSERGSLIAYVKTVTRNAALSYQRRVRGHRRLESVPEPVAPDEGDFSNIAYWELDAAVESLPGRERETIECLFREGMTVSETAEKMGVTPETVRSTKSHALKNLQKKME